MNLSNAISINIPFSNGSVHTHIGQQLVTLRKSGKLLTVRNRKVLYSRWGIYKGARTCTLKKFKTRHNFTLTQSEFDNHPDIDLFKVTPDVSETVIR